MGSDPQYTKYPDLSLAQDIFLLTNPSSSKTSRQTSLQRLQDAISKYKMAPLYRHLAHPESGLLNGTGVGSAQKSAQSGAKKSSDAANLLAGKNSTSLLDFPWDEKLYESLVKENEQELEDIQKEEDEAAEKAGETEVQAAKGKRAEFWARVGDKVRCIEPAKEGLLLTLFIARTMPSRPTKLCLRRRVS